MKLRKKLALSIANSASGKSEIYHILIGYLHTLHWEATDEDGVLPVDQALEIVNNLNKFFRKYSKLMAKSVARSDKLKKEIMQVKKMYGNEI